MAYYKDLRQFIQTLDEKGKLIRIKRLINKDTELHPLARLQFRGLPSEERKAFLFENVTDSKGKKYNVPVALCVLAANREVYALGMGCTQDKILDKWAQAQLHPIEPKLVKNGPVHEEVHIGKSLTEHGGLEEFPVPISTPGYDSAPFLTSPYWITKDPETGTINVGTYRAHIKSPVRTGMMAAAPTQHIAMHLAKARKMKKPLEAAVVIGGPPNVGYVSVTRNPYEVNELAIAGGIAGEPLEVVKCKTVDIEVPAYSEMVFEGIIPTDEVEPEAPFGEALGYMGVRYDMPFFNVTCITHRKNPIFQGFLSQFPPSESSMIRGTGREGAAYTFLKYTNSQPWVVEVALPESTGSAGIIVIQVTNTDQPNVWKTLEATSGWVKKNSPNTRFIIAIGEDISVRDAEAINWAMTTRVQPHRDCRIETGKGESLLDLSLVSPAEYKKNIRFETMPMESRLLINATAKWSYPPVSLPKKKFMENAIKIWEEEKLPALKLKEPWWGYNLGYWFPEWDDQADMAANGDYKLVGELLAKERKKLT